MSVPALDQQKERKRFANDSLSPAYVHHKTPHQVPLTLSCSCCELIYPTVWNQTERKNTHMQGVQHICITPDSSWHVLIPQILIWAILEQSPSQIRGEIGVTRILHTVNAQGVPPGASHT